MNRAEQILEFDKIKNIWMTFALTDVAKKQIEAMKPTLDETELTVWQRQTTEAKLMMEKCGTPPLTSFAGMREILASAEKESCLTAEQLEVVATNLTAIRRLKDYLNRGKSYDLSLAYYEENLESCDEVREEIAQQIRNGRVDDHATPMLFNIRKQLIHEDEKMRDKANQIMRNNKSYMADSFSTMRNGHICLPVKKEYVNKISGSIMDKSATGSTIFVEPTSVYSHYETIQLLRIDEENEEMRIRYVLTDRVLEVAELIKQSMTTVEKLDFAFSKAKLSMEYDGVRPNMNTDRRIILKEARHPLMEKAVCVPLDFRIGETHDGEQTTGVIITGPNTGGKTVTLKTVALCSMMAQCGLHVPCKKADICMNANFLCDIGDGQNLAENLSTFSAHLKNILEILQNVNRESLVVLDELGSGTDPAEGMGIAIAVLKELKKSGALFLVTTHYPEIKQFAKEEAGVTNARMDFDKQTLMPLYRLIIGESGESQAFSIAKRLGMSDEMLKVAASAAYGAEYEKHLPRMDREKEGDKVNTGLDAEKAQARKKTEARKQTRTGPKIKKHKVANTTLNKPASKFNLGDSVMIYPDKKIGIVCQPADEKGILRVQLPNKKIYINHKRVKLHVAAAELYPEDYDFSIIFDSVENRKLRHQMSRKYVEDILVEEE
ncbi:MAG: DNA mismatch repair protein MutS [Roseburia sp.]|nr:DNA mismatch repair protein MutS [Roseburia sp.]